MVLLALRPGCFSVPFWRLCQFLFSAHVHVFVACPFHRGSAFLKVATLAPTPSLLWAMQPSPRVLWYCVHTSAVQPPRTRTGDSACFQAFACSLHCLFPTELMLHTLYSKSKRLSKKVLWRLQAIVVLLKAAKKCS